MLHQIGIGALGPVFRTYEPTRDRLVAVKVFRLDIVPEQAQALAEALTRATQASLFHPSIVEPIAAGVEGTLAYRAEEYVAAESLDVAMRHYAPAAVEKVLPFITQLAGAIDFARAAGVGHGGLHPRDIFVTPDEARATGFGIVEALQDVGVRAPIRRPYAAPERIDGIKWGTAADVFSLAAIAFELLTGRRPSGTGARIGALDGEHNPALHAVLARAMDDDFSQRYQTALAFASALETASKEAAAVPSVVAVPPPMPTPPPAPAVIAPTPEPVPTPGELEVEKELDPVLAALDEDISAERDGDDAAVADRLRFDEPALDGPIRGEDVEAESFADLGEVEPERFADDFVEEQQAQAESRRPLEAVHETTKPIAAAAALPRLIVPDAAEPETHDVHDYSDRSRPAILPYAVTLILGLLLGFGAAYFVFGGGRTDAPATAATTVPAPAPVQQPATAPTGPATPDKPGQYSEQKVTPPASTAGATPSVATAPPAAAPPPTAAPPIPDESAPAASPRRSRPAAAATTTGRVVVTSTPSRANVTVNGIWRGRTPLTLSNLSYGRYVVRVVQSGYNVARDEFTLNAQNAAHEFSPRLQRSTSATPAASTPAPATRQTPSGAPSASPATFTGSLYVDSRPRGATVFVDGRRVGTTPLSLPEVAIGTHVVRIEMTGKQTWTSTTRVTAGALQRVTGSLEDIRLPNE